MINKKRFQTNFGSKPRDFNKNPANFTFGDEGILKGINFNLDVYIAFSWVAPNGQDMFADKYGNLTLRKLVNSPDPDNSNLFQTKMETSDELVE